MSRNLDVDFLDDDPTDELPVLSEERLLEYSLMTPDAAEASGSGKAPPVQPPAVSPELQTDLVRLFDRIGEFEGLLAEKTALLERQQHELAEQQRDTEHWREQAAHHERQCAELSAMLAMERQRAATATVATVAEAPAAEPPTVAPITPADDLQHAREEIAALSDYIAARNEIARTLEAELASRELRIAELSIELEQRLAREHQAEERARQDAARAQALEQRLGEALALLTERERQLQQAAGDQVATQTLSRDLAVPAAAEHGIDPADANGAARLVAGTEPAPSGDSRLFMAWPPAADAISSLVCMTSDEPTTYPLKPSTTVTIGRGEQCEVQVSTHYVSREHARLIVGAKHVTVEDLGSRNGVFVNDVRVQAEQLRHGDLVTIGETQFRFVSANPG